MKIVGNSKLSNRFIEKDLIAANTSTGALPEETDVDKTIFPIKPEIVTSSFPQGYTAFNISFAEFENN